jgi:hypothetical protein
MAEQLNCASAYVTVTVTVVFAVPYVVNIN